MFFFSGEQNISQFGQGGRYYKGVSGFSLGLTLADGFDSICSHRSVVANYSCTMPGKTVCIKVLQLINAICFNL